jgi:hypothetical protein
MNEERIWEGWNGARFDRLALTPFAYIRHSVSNRQYAEDVLVDVFLAAFKSEGRDRLPDARQ